MGGPAMPPNPQEDDRTNPSFPTQPSPSQPINPQYGQPSYASPRDPQPGQPLVNSPYPTNEQPFYAAPSQPFNPPPQFGQVPPKRRMRAWQWILISVGAILVLCCGCGLIATLLNGSHSTTSANQFASNNTPGVTSTPGPTSTPQPTATPQPTVTPHPTSTPIPPGIGDHMALGHDFGQNSNGFYILKPADKFTSADQFAFVVNLDHGVGTTQAKIVLVKEEAGGAESVVLSIPMNISNPDFASFANKFSTATLMYGDAAGAYKLEMETDTSVVASAKFTYLG